MHLEDFYSALNVSNEYSGAGLMLGAHPWYLDGLDWLGWKDALQRNLQRIAGIGEVGLDRLWGADYSVQLEIFEKAVSLAEERKLPLNVHCVRAWKDLWEILRGRKDLRVILHAYNGSTFYVERFSLMPGVYFSLGPTVLKWPKEKRRVIQTIGLDRLLVESDWPYQAQSPRILGQVVEKIAEWKAVPKEEVAQAVEANFKDLLRR